MKENLKDKNYKTATPVMKQFWDAKKEHPDSIMLFRMGDFYETFDEDAKLASSILGIALTKRSNGAASAVPLAGFPYHALDQYLHKLLNAGYKVAICEQVEDPKLAKGIVKREVVEILSPGAALSEKFLNHDENNFLCSLFFDKEMIGYSILDYSTGEFSTGKSNINHLNNIINRFQVKEIIVSEKQEDILKMHLKDEVYISTYNEWIADYTVCYDKLIDHFKTRSLKGFGLDSNKLEVVSSGASLFYVENNFFGKIKHITSINKIVDDEFMMLDSFTIKNLEIFNSISNQNSKGTLFASINNTKTPMGARLLRNQLVKPLTNKKYINQRLSYVEELLNNNQSMDFIATALKSVFDIERILSKVSTNKSNPRDLVNLSSSLKFIYQVIKNNKSLKKINSFLKKSNNLNDLINLIDSNINEEPPINISKGGYIKSGVSKELDDLRKISKNANEWLVQYQQDERDSTGISSLKIGYNKVFGYYIDITKTHIDKVPAEYIRKQTLTNSERYFTEELKDYEDKILTAQDQIVVLEVDFFERINAAILNQIKEIQYNAFLIAAIDVNLSHAINAQENNFSKPLVSDSSSKFKLIESRHPVVEKLLPSGEKFISNNIEIDCNQRQLAIITGPNMAGKSTFLRQIGIISILAQIGSYVPAKKANISIVDQLFTRVGASDNLAGGESTFLVEMNEAANILNNATQKSLIILDEIGRGTSTFDGLSLAWSIAEYIHNNKKIKAKTLFATHYHELIYLADKLPDAFNLNVVVKEQDDQIFFIRKIKEGGASKSYGINVAKMAGIPAYVIKRAQELLNDFMNNKNDTKFEVKKTSLDSSQVELFNFKEEIINEIKKTDVNKLTPIEALNVLNKIKNKIR